MAATDFTAFLSPQDKAKLARQVGIPIGDGRVFKRGVIVSAGDTANSLAEQARQAALTSQTGQFADRTGTVNPNQAAQQAYSGYMQSIQPQPSAQFMPQPGAQQAPAAPAGIQPGPSPMFDPATASARATLTQQWQERQAQMQPAALPPMPNMASGAPSSSFLPSQPQQPQGQIMVNGAPYSPPQTPLAAPMSEQNMMLGTALARQSMREDAALRAPGGTLANKVYSPQEQARMNPLAIQARVAWDQQRAKSEADKAATALETQKTQAGIAKTQAETAALGQPKARDAFDVAYSAFTQQNPKATPEQVQQFINDYRAKGTPQTNVNLGGDEFAKAAGKYGAERMSATYEAATSLPSTLSKVDETIEILKTGDPSTGLGAEVKTTVARVASLFGSKKAGERVSDTEYLEALLGSEVFAQIQALGIGARGLDTPKEREFLQKSITGEKAMSRDALIRLAEARKNVLMKAAEKYNERVRKGEFDRFFEASGLQRYEVPTTATQSQEQQPTSANAQQTDSAQATPAQAVKLSPAALKYVK